VRDFWTRSGDRPRRRRGARARERRPLLGIPLTVKESYNIAGLPTTWAIRRRRFSPLRGCAGDLPRQDAGGVILGKTNVRSAGRLARAQRHLRHHNNPYDLGPRPAARPADHPGGRGGYGPLSLARTGRLACVCRRSTAASMHTSRHSRWCHRAATRRRRFLAAARSRHGGGSGRWRAARWIFRFCSTSSGFRTRWRPGRPTSSVAATASRRIEGFLRAADPIPIR